MKKLLTSLLLMFASTQTASAWDAIDIIIAADKFDPIAAKMSVVMEDICANAKQPMTFSWNRKYWEYTTDPDLGLVYKGRMSKTQMGSYVNLAKLNTYRNDLKPFKVGKDFDINVITE